ncbi:MAG: hypothetical protein ABSC41_16210 [Acidimicrobiales bacterium]
MDSVVRGGQRPRGADKRASTPTAYQLLAADVDAPVRPSEIAVPEEYLEDLYVHPLVITPDYVGADRRYVGADRRLSAVRPARDRRVGVGPGPTLRAAEILVIVVVTLSVAVPLTLLASHAAVAGTSSHPPAAFLPSSPGTLGTATLPRATTSYPSRAARSAARAHLALQREARRAAARAADASRQRAARAARVRQREVLRREARIRRHDRLERARARRR